MPDQRIRELLETPIAQRDLTWLKWAVLEAVKFEFATIPPYLTAYWSIKNSGALAAKIILPIIIEEMLHMALMCNLAAGLGMPPALADTSVVPTYPGPLPGGIKPGFELGLEGLSIAVIRKFMEVEYPEGGPVVEAVAETFPTIGAFYHAISNALRTVNPQLDTSKQLAGPLGLTKLSTVDEALDAIDTVTRQGEGTPTSPIDTGPNDLAHFYRFGELLHQRRLVIDEQTQKWSYTGVPVPNPDVWPAAPVPHGGYSKGDVSEAVWQMLDRFDRSYSQMLGDMAEAWSTGSQSKLDSAIGTMSFGLSDAAIELMSTQRPDGLGTYAPCFRLT